MNPSLAQLAPSLAAIDPGFIIWLVIIAIFGLSNLLKAGKKQQKRPPPRKTSGSGGSGGSGGSRTTPPPRPAQRSTGGETEQEIRLRESQARAQRQREARDSKRAATAANRDNPTARTTRAQQQRTAPPPRPSSRPPTMEEQMRQLYEQMTGQPAGNKPSRPADARMKVKPKKPAPDPRLKVQAKTPTTPTTSTTPTTPTAPTSTSLAAAPTAPSEVDAFAQVEEIQDIMSVQETMEHHTGGSHNTMGTRSMLIDLGKLNLPLMRIPIIPMDTVDNVADKPNLRDKKILRTAVLARVILEKPKALQSSPNEDAEQI